MNYEDFHHIIFEPINQAKAFNKIKANYLLSRYSYFDYVEILDKQRKKRNFIHILKLLFKKMEVNKPIYDSNHSEKEKQFLYWIT